MSGIEWTDTSWNPLRGCSMARGSEAGGCLNCYAARMAARNLPSHRSPTTSKPFAVMRGAGPRWTGAVELISTKLEEPLHWRKPRKCFVNSMSDLFHEELSFEEIAAVFGVMAVCPHITFQVLTKRPERALKWFEWASSYPVAGPDVCCQRKAIELGVDLPTHSTKGTLKAFPWPLPNVWLGISAEDQETFDARWDHLRRCPAAVQWWSYEPALGPVDARSALISPHPRLDWVVAGGESGPGARPCDVNYIRRIMWDCRIANVPVFVKQLGARPFDLAGDHLTSNGEPPVGAYLDLESRKGGDWNEWPFEFRIRQFPEQGCREMPDEGVGRA